MKELTTYERMKRVFERREPDRIPFIDTPWAATLERWRKEGMPEKMDWRLFFGTDLVEGIGVDNSPRYDTVVIEETDEYKIFKTSWGATLKDFKHSATVPEFLDFTVTSREKWEDAKKRMTPSTDRVNWKHLKENYKEWRKDGRWITGAFWFGFDVSHSWMVGTEQFLIWLVEDPELCMDIFNTYLELDIAMFEKIWDDGYRFDSISWPDDMGFKGKQFFSVDMYRELLKPYHKKAVDWAHAKGIKAQLHSCGDVNPFIPEFIDIGIDSLNPIEVKAGMDPLVIKEKYGDKLVLHGGTNAVNWPKHDVIINEIKRIVPGLKQNGGYIFASDHSIPSDVSLEKMREIVRTVKEVGAY
jgi:uroporphyrinogen decarboxylase